VAVIRRLTRSRTSPPKIEAAESWQIGFHAGAERDLRIGDILVDSELALPAKPEYGGGLKTKRIVTTRLADRAEVNYEERPARQAEADHCETTPPAGQERVWAYIRYADDLGPRTFAMTQDEITVGRGGLPQPVALRLKTLPDVSREHIRIRRDPATGRFYLKDLSTLGTTLDGESVPRSVEDTGSGRGDSSIEVPLPEHALIGLAGILSLEFEAVNRP
jgi:hypothetical protein